MSGSSAPARSHAQAGSGKSQTTATTGSTASKWGSFFQGAVAGLESRLDTILAEDGSGGSGANGNGGASSGSSGTAKGNGNGSVGVEGDGSTGSTSVSRSGSVRAGNKGGAQGPLKGRPPTNDRLQQRLAKVVGSGVESKASSRASSSEPVSRSASPTAAVLKHVTQQNSENVMDTNSQGGDATGGGLNEKGDKDIAVNDDRLGTNKRINPAPEITKSTSSISTSQVSDSTTFHGPIDLISEVSQENLLNKGSANGQVSYDAAEVDRLRKAHEDDSKARQEELHAHMERIDALQAKLLYLTKSAAEAAQRAASKASASTLEKKLAEKEEQLALLMEEGQKLSKTEMKHLGAIKRLQAKAAEENKASADLRKKLANAEKAAEGAAENAKRAQGAEKQVTEKTKRLDRLSKEFQSLTDQQNVSKSTIESLRRQLVEANKRCEAAEKKARSDATDSERQSIVDLKDELADTRIEKKLLEDRLKAEVRDVKAESHRQQDRASLLETELRNEISNLEHKLEAFRSRTEEVSSSSTADSQAKLLRQLERLQSQYALASENWQGIEATLSARATALERERDESTKREAELRKKAREMTLRVHVLEEELERANERSNLLEGELLEERSQIRKLKNNVSDLNVLIVDCEKQLKQLQGSTEATLERRLADEKVKWQAGLNSIQTDMSSSRAESPIASYRKLLNSDMLGGTSRNASIARLNDFRPSFMDQSFGSRSSYAMQSPGIETPTSLDHYNTLSPVNGASRMGSIAPRSPSAAPIDPDDAFDTTVSQPRTAADIISTGTTGAGPSVQLVERMSAAVRKLESEKAAAKEEHARVLAQRDEARKEVVALMSESEQKDELEAKVRKLEEELEKMDERYQTTLELLGEKSERVDELTNDVADLKQIYRELVETKTA